MIDKLSPTTMLNIKAVLFAVVLLIPFLPFMGLIHFGTTWWTPLFIFGLIPFVDHLFGKDPANPTIHQANSMDKNPWYKSLTLAMMPLYLAFLATAGWVFGVGIDWLNWDWFDMAGWILSCGVIGAVIAINTGHELTHKDSKIEQIFGGILLSAVCYATFKVEHVRGHHVNVSTPADASSAYYGESLYQFLPRAYKNNFINGWRLEARRLNGQGLSAFHWRNELIWWYALTAAFAGAFAYAWGWLGVLFFFAQAFIAVTLLEIVNYVEHYGLEREFVPETGRYVRVTPAHSWNSNFLFTNLFLFHLQRHSDHHAFAKRRYQILRHYDESPQLPSSYAGMVPLALIPPLWFRVMNPRVDAYRMSKNWSLSNEEFIKKATKYEADDLRRH